MKTQRGILFSVLALFFMVVVMIGYVFVHSEFFAPSATNSAIRELDIIQEELELAKDNRESQQVFDYHIEQAKVHISRARKDLKAINF